MKIITVENISKQFKTPKKFPGFIGAIKSLFTREYTIKNAVQNISFDIEEGEIVGYLGANGAGKSTTIKMMTGILTPTEGKITINGIVPYEQREKNARSIGVVFGQRTQLWWDIPLNETYTLLKNMYDISDEDFETLVEKYSVYARVQPEHKTRIVNAWRKKGKITAMTGDGVNDAPSIKNADIGVGMGITGTDVTKNVADMILADDNFATIVSAAGEGRRIYDNIRKAIQFLLASNLSEVLTIFFATLLGIQNIFLAVHLLWINLITDCFPALALGMEKPEDDVMKRAPRDSKEGIFAGGEDLFFRNLIFVLRIKISLN